MASIVLLLLDLEEYPSNASFTLLNNKYIYLVRWFPYKITNVRRTGGGRSAKSGQVCGQRRGGGIKSLQTRPQNTFKLEIYISYIIRKLALLDPSLFLKI